MPTKKTSKVLYPEASVRKYTGKQALNQEDAMKYLGWTVEGDDEDFGDNYDLRNVEGKKVRVMNNVLNRKLRPNRIAALRQEILRKNWRFNGQTIVIGKEGHVLDGANQMVALVISGEEWDQKTSVVWRENWKTKPVIEKLVALGVGEDDETANTMDTGDPRTLADVFYRSQYFRDIATKQRNQLSRGLSYATQLMWQRTGFNSEGLMKTHTEYKHFIDQHPKLVEAVKYIYEENEDNRIGYYLSPGYSAALMYMMSCSETSDEKLSNYAEDANEKFLSFKLLRKAQKFFTLLGSGDKEIAPAVRGALSTLQEEEVGGLVRARQGIIVKAWNLWIEEKKITPKNVCVKWSETEDGVRSLDETPIIGGIDLGE